MLPMPLVKSIVKSEVIHKERLNNDEPCIYIPNHTSLLDAVVLAMHLPKDIVFVANTEIAKKYAWAMKGREVLTVDTTNFFSVRSMLKVLKQGKSLVIFPEGRITRTNSLMKIYLGVSFLGIKTGFPLVPIGIDGGEKAKVFTYLEGKIPTSWFPKMTVYVGEKFKIPEMPNETMREKKEMGTHLIYRQLQEVLLKCRTKNSVHLVEEFRKRVKEAPNLEIAEDLNGKVTMKELWRKVLGLSMILDSKTTDKRIGVLMPTSIAGMAGVLAILNSGKSPAMLNFSMDAPTLESCLSTGEIKTVLTARSFIEKGKLQHLVEACSKTAKVLFLEDFLLSMTTGLKLKVLASEGKQVTSPAGDIILFTSGSEGTPKGVVLTHDNIYANIQQARLVIDFTSQDKIIHALPIFHSFGLIVSFLSPLCHVPMFMVPSPLLYKAIPEIAYDKLGTLLFGTSTFLSAYGRNAHPYDFNKMRYVFSGAEKLQDHVRDMWIDKFGIRLLEGYGLTETSPILSLQTPMLYKRGTVGCLVPGVKHRIETVDGVEEGGKLLIQAPNLMKGYLISGQGFVPTPEWFDTGDIISLDKKGFVSILGRAKRFVKIGGEMISLAAVEQSVKQAIGEGEFVAVRVSDAKKGERIELVATSPETTKEKLREYWKTNNLTSLSLPSTIHIVKEIPLLGSGKADVTKITKEIQSKYD